MVKKYNRICQNEKCENRFSSNLKTKIFCSERCRRAVYKRKKADNEKADREHINCLNCGVEFIPFPLNRKYCTTYAETIRKERFSTSITNYIYSLLNCTIYVQFN